MDDTATICESDDEFNILKSCPFTIAKVQFDKSKASSTWLIREHDSYGEYPHIYAKLCSAPTSDKGKSAQVVVLSDTGCGTSTDNPEYSNTGHLKQPKEWNIRTFLEFTINPQGRIPYLVVTTHCHYDHILGINKLPPSKSTNRTHFEALPIDPRHLRPLSQVLSSAKGQSFITPYSNLQKHSLCSTIGLAAPHYDVTTWAHDFMEVKYTHPDGTTIPTNITIIHTQGHTPDSLTWYDSDLHLLCVGDSFYSKESKQTRSAPWGPEPPMPTMFDLESDMAAWWGAMGKILGFVKLKNEDLRHEFTSPHRVEEGVGEQAVDDQLHSNLNALKTSQTGLKADAFVHDIREVNRDQDGADEDDAWLIINKDAPRVKLCAAHTTLSLDAETAILEMRSFFSAVISAEVPSKKVEDGPRGEVRWLWDYDLGKTKDKRSAFSILAPLSLIRRARLG